MGKGQSLFLFSHDIGEGRIMLFGVLGKNPHKAEKSLTELLKAGKICEPRNPASNIVRVDVVTNGTRETAFYTPGYDDEFEALMENYVPKEK